MRREEDQEVLDLSKGSLLSNEQNPGKEEGNKANEVERNFRKKSTIKSEIEFDMNFISIVNLISNKNCIKFSKKSSKTKLQITNDTKKPVEEVKKNKSIWETRYKQDKATSRKFPVKNHMKKTLRHYSKKTKKKNKNNAKFNRTMKGVKRRIFSNLNYCSKMKKKKRRKTTEEKKDENVIKVEDKRECRASSLNPFKNQVQSGRFRSVKKKGKELSFSKSPKTAFEKILRKIGKRRHKKHKQTSQEAFLQFKASSSVSKCKKRIKLGSKTPESRRLDRKRVFKTIAADEEQVGHAHALWKKSGVGKQKMKKGNALGKKKKQGWDKLSKCKFESQYKIGRKCNFFEARLKKTTNDFFNLISKRSNYNKINLKGYKANANPEKTMRRELKSSSLEKKAPKRSTKISDFVKNSHLG